jgi:hypothetical protein
MSTVRLPWLASIALLAACTQSSAPSSVPTATGSEAVPTATVTTSEPAATAPPSSPLAEPAPEPTAVAPAPEAEGLGGPCRGAPNVPAEPAWGTKLCGPGGKVVGVFGPGDGAGPIPEGARVLAKSDDAGRATSSIAVVGDELRIVMITCGDCRRIMGWTFVGHPKDMNDAQRKAVQGFVGLDPAVAPLASTDAWSRQKMPALKTK